MRRLFAALCLLAVGLVPMSSIAADTHPTRAPHQLLNTSIGCVNRVHSGISTLSRSLPDRPLVVAYYYQWFDQKSWTTKKKDYPLIGHYDSSDLAVMCNQIQLAKGAGIDGFIVSWKHQDPNDDRLTTLIKVAQAENFRLGIIYQGLDVSRRPQPVARISRDLGYFVSHFADQGPLRLFGPKPLMIWSGTARFTTADIARLTGRYGRNLLMLGYANNLQEYDRIAPFFAGNAYYWSSGNPRTTPGYAAKLVALGRAVHADHGIWIAPFAPGFDARLVCVPQTKEASGCGTRVVDRDGGKTLAASYAAASSSHPDAFGLISWNEFSENTYVEPSLKYGTRYLDYLRALLDVRTGPSPAETELTRINGTTELDSDSPPGRTATGIAALAISIAAIFLMAVIIRHRSHRRLSTQNGG